MRILRCLSIGALIGLAAAIPAGQTPTAGTPPAIRSSTSAVVVDVVVSDRTGAPVMDLVADDFELFEDEVRQTIAAVTPAGPTALPGTAATSVMALVFNPRSPDGRTAARRAARIALDAPAQPTDLVGVFVSEAPLRTIQPYTSSRAAIRRAVDVATSRAATAGGRARPVPGRLDPTTSPTAGAASAGRSGNDPGAATERLVQRMTDRMEEAYKEIQREGAGQGATASLLAIVASLGTLPGRKTLVFFAEDFAVPDAVASRFQAIIDTANRANVAIYGVDTAGLRVRSGRSQTARDPSASLGVMARQTGGFLIDGTNDLATAFRRIDADRRFHYLLTYAPAKADVRGEYRRIRVAVRRPHLEVRAGGGYVASPGPASFPLLRAEAAAIAALAQPRRPTQIALRGRALLFPRQDGAADVAVAVSMRAGDVSHRVDAAGEGYRTDFTILARLVDAHGNVIWKGSQPYGLQGAVAALDRARAGAVVFSRQARMPAGTYTLEYAVHDALADQAGTGSEPVTIEPQVPGALAVSSLVIIRAAELVPAGERDATHPLQVGEIKLSPNVGEPVSKGDRGRLTFCLRVWPSAAPTATTLELRWSDLPMASVTLPPPAPDPDGRLTYLATIPLADIPAGPCELRATVSDGSTRVTRTVPFILER